MSFTRELFGGAITAVLPTRLIDASDIRQIPDTQEVYLYPDAETSIIVEILQRVEASNLHESITFHFNSLAHDNSAQSSTIHTIDVPPPCETNPPTLLTGTQLVPKYNRTEPDTVHILMALFRIEGKPIDLVITVNLPMASSSPPPSLSDAAAADFMSLVKSLQIVDYGLFLDGEGDVEMQVS